MLRRAEAGERLTITVNGRPVAELGPLARARGPAGPTALARILADCPIDAGWADELERARAAESEAAEDPWSS